MPPGTEDAPQPPAVYALGSDDAERERLRRQSVELEGQAAALLDRVGLGPGQSAIDLGCGPRGIVDLLSSRVGPGGRVVGVELDPTNVALVRSVVRDEGLGNVTIIEGDARHTGLDTSSLDVAHARTLLVNIPDPATVVAEMVRLIRPGGWVCGMEPEMSVYIYHPPHPVWDRLHEIFIRAFQADGADPFIGRRLPELYRNAGLTDVGAEAGADLLPPGHSRRTMGADLVRPMRTKIVARGIASEQELDQLDRAARQYLADPHTLALPGLYFLAWGRKPAA